MKNMILIAIITAVAMMLAAVKGEITCYSCLHFELTSSEPMVQEMLHSLNVVDENCLAEEHSFTGEDAKTEVCDFQCYKETGKANLVYLNKYNVDLRVLGRGCTVMEKEEECVPGLLDGGHDRLKDMVPHFQELDLCYCDQDLCNSSPKLTGTSLSSLVMMGWSLVYCYKFYTNWMRTV